MGILRRASSETKQIALDDDDYIVVRADLAQNDFEKLVGDMPFDVDQEKGLTPAQGLQTQHALFSTLMVGWSLEYPCNLEEYGLLETRAAIAINEKLAEHFNVLQLNETQGKKRKT